MPMAAIDHTTFLSPEPCELLLRLKLRRVGMRVERSGFGYRLLHGDTLLLSRGPNGFGLSLADIECFADGLLRRLTYEPAAD